ncbi:MAG: hypothetical protein NTY15_20845 [Planctomycetota bacterium]|nr:hypothetical protein [Planctomycetota bacterium]
MRKFCSVENPAASDAVSLLDLSISHFVAKLVKSFGGLRNAAESLDDFRYRKGLPNMDGLAQLRRNWDR